MKGVWAGMRRQISQRSRYCR